MTRKRKFKYDRYLIELPSEAYKDKEELLQDAIYEAEQKTRLYCIPCNWTAEIVEGSMDNSGKIIVRVIRKRLA